MRKANGLDIVAEFPDTQITGVAVTTGGSIFVCSPYWMEPHPWSVLEIRADGTRHPYPNKEWNTWREGLDPAAHFVCVQSVYIDQRNPETLWILDAASPMMEGVVPGGPKLVEMDLKTNNPLNVYHFGPGIAPEQSYLNDVRVDALNHWAYITESGTGALIVLNLKTHEVHRVLDTHPSTKVDPNKEIFVNGNPVRNPDGSTPQFHADGIALSDDDKYLYYHALTGTRLYRVPTAILQHATMSSQEMARHVEDMGETGVTDGMLADTDGSVYQTALEDNAIVRRTPEGRVETVVKSALLQWPDSMSWGPEGYLYVSTSQINKMPKHNGGQDMRTEPYRVFRIPMEEI